MGLTSLICWLAVTIAAADAPAAPKLPEPIVTRQGFFAIPFRVASADHPSREPREVQLYVSGDRGATWQLYARAMPAQRQFLFRAACDGEFWFAVRTIDAANQARPAQVAGPEMRVLIDTAPPKLDVAAKATDDGAVVAQWRVDDVRVKPDALKLTYRVGADGPWLPITIAPQTAGTAGAMQAGEARFQPATAGDIQIRAEVCDAAGNPAVSHAQVKLAQAQAPSAANVADAGSRVTPPADATTSWASEPYPVAGQNRYPSTTTPEPLRAADAYTPATPSAPVANNAGAGAGLPTESASRPQVSSPAPSAPAEVRWVTTRRIELDYDTNPLAGIVQRVEIWGTTDAGRTWRSMTVDDDRQSPVAVTVDRDGVYGFRMVIQQANAPLVRAPQPGDLPDLTIGVNTAK